MSKYDMDWIVAVVDTKKLRMFGDLTPTETNLLLRTTSKRWEFSWLR